MKSIAGIVILPSTVVRDEIFDFSRFFWSAAKAEITTSRLDIGVSNYVVRYAIVLAVCTRDGSTSSRAEKFQ